MKFELTLDLGSLTEEFRLYSKNKFEWKCGIFKGNTQQFNRKYFEWNVDAKISSRNWAVYENTRSIPTMLPTAVDLFKEFAIDETTLKMKAVGAS